MTPQPCAFCPAEASVIYAVVQDDWVAFCGHHAAEILGPTPAEMFAVLERAAA